MYIVHVYSKEKEGDKYLREHFKVREFACADGSDMILISLELAEVLDNMRRHFNAPIIINSAYRTASHNKKVGGAKRSQHLYGNAADIVVKGVSPAKVAAYAETLLQEKGGIGEYRGFVHIDVRKEKARWKSK